MKGYWKHFIIITSSSNYVLHYDTYICHRFPKTSSNFIQTSTICITQYRQISSSSRHLGNKYWFLTQWESIRNESCCSRRNIKTTFEPPWPRPTIHTAGECIHQSCCSVETHPPNREPRAGHCCQTCPHEIWRVLYRI